MKCDLTAERLRCALEYEPRTGNFIWRERPSNRVRVGDIAGNVNKRTGYKSIKIDGLSYYSHRLAWLHVYGEWPQGIIDHRDGDKTNNRIENLRAATLAQNAANAKRPVHNTSGFKGAWFHGRDRRWVANIKVDRKTKYLGSFDTREEAHAAYMAAARSLHGEFASGGQGKP